MCALSTENEYQEIIKTEKMSKMSQVEYILRPLYWEYISAPEQSKSLVHCGGNIKRSTRVEYILGP